MPIFTSPEGEPISDEMSEDQRELITEMRKNFEDALEGDNHNRREGLEDMKFTNESGYQWDENMKKERGNRPCWEFNKVRISVKRVVNNMRANRPDGKIRPVEDGDTKRAEILSGLIRNILNVSDADTILDYQGNYQVSAGMGAWRVVTEYADDDSFNQDIKVQNIPNPFTLFCDPVSQDQMRRDARWWILTERISKDEFNERWGNSEDVVQFPDHEFDDDDEWESKEEDIRIAEYWYQRTVDGEIWQLATGQVIDADTDEAQVIEQSMPEMIVKRRQVKRKKIFSCIMSGNSILEGPFEWAGKHFPFIVVYGDFNIIDGRTYWHGMTRFAKDPQKAYNVSRTSMGESIAQTPKTFFWATTKQAEGNVRAWKTAHQKALPFLLYTPDPQVPGPPARMGPADIPTALVQETQMAAEEINMVTGIYQADMGAPNAAKSGRQEIARQQQGHLATFHLEDNMAKGVQRTWEILLDLVPKVYDSARQLRVLGSDGADDFVQVNQPVPNTDPPQVINDITVGKYDVTVTIGPSFTTKRQEAVDTYMPILQATPDLMPIIGDLVFKSMDLPYAEDIAERLRAMLPPQIQQLVNKDKDLPPEVQMAMQQVQQAMQVMQQREEAVVKMAQEAEMEQTKNQKIISDIRAARSDFNANVAERMAQLKSYAAELVVKKAELGDDAELIDRAAELDSSYAEMMAGTVAGMQNVAQALSERLDEAAETIRNEANPRPKVTRVEMRRVDGKAVAVPIYEDAE